MSQVPITLQDGSGVSRQFFLSPDDAKRCETDVVFAQRLWDSASKSTSCTSTDVGPSSSTSTTTSSSRNSDAEEDVISSFKWPHSAVLLLVETYSSHESALTSGKVSQKKVWEMVSSAMAKKGHVVSGPQCLSKFNGMKRTYKAISDHNSKSGNNPRLWPYLQVMGDLLGERPFMEPPSLASSSRRTRTDSDCSIDHSVDEPSPRSRARKRKASEDLSYIANAILESRKIAEENQNRRHEERCALKKSLMAKLDEMIKKL